MMFCRRDAARDHVDDVGLGQHRADRGAGLRVVGLERQRSDLIERQPAEVAGEMFSRN